MRKPDPRIDTMWKTLEGLDLVVGRSFPLSSAAALFKNKVNQIPILDRRLTALEGKIDAQSTNWGTLHRRVDNLSKMVHSQQAQFSFILDQMFESLPQEARLKFVQKLAADGFDSDALRFTKRL